MSYDEDEHVKSVFAHFGLAYYLAGVFEAGLANALLQLNFLTKQKALIEQAGDFDRSKYEAEFDSFVKEQDSKTLGNLIKNFSQLTNVNEELKALIATTKARRDFLAHHFFREWAEEFAQRNGRDTMIAELEQDQELFRAADKRLDDHLKPILTALGWRLDVIKTYVEDYILSVKNGSKYNSEPGLSE